MSNNHRKRFLIVLVITVVVMIMMIYSVLPSSFINRGTTPLSYIFKPIENVIIKLGDSTRNYFSVTTTNKELNNLIEELEEQNVDLRLQIKENEASALEYEKIKNAYNLSKQYEYSAITAGRILQKPLNNDTGLYRIDKGINDGIDLAELEGFPVVDANANVFGRIYTSDAISSKVLPITHEGFSVRCYIEDNRGQAFALKGDINYKDQNLCLLDEIPRTTVINVGDQIITSGLGGIFPYGIEIGQVVEILPVNKQGVRQALIKPAVDFSNTDIVFIMTGSHIPLETEDAEE